MNCFLTCSILCALLCLMDVFGFTPLLIWLVGVYLLLLLFTCGLLFVDCCLCGDLPYVALR